MRVVVYLPADPRSPALARRFCRDACDAGRVTTSTSADAALLVSELVTNAITHAASEVTVMIHASPTLLQVAISDRAIDRDVPLAAHGQGRGLHLLDALAQRWRVDRDCASKTVWFELDLKTHRTRDDRLALAS